MTALARTIPNDVADAVWLDEQVADLGRGIEAAKAIWSNWFDGRQVGRLHPGMTAGEYIESLGYRLSPIEAMEALPEASSSEVGRVAGVTGARIRQLRAQGVSDLQPDRVTGADGKSYPRVVREVKAEIIETKEEESPIGEGMWDELVSVMEAIEALTVNDATRYAATVPDRRRATTAKKLRKLGTYLGRIAWTLEGTE